MIDVLSRPWPWWISGPLLGLIVPLLLWYGGKLFGISSSLRHVCAAACGEHRPQLFRYDWRREGLWNLAFVAGLVAGGWLAGSVFAPAQTIVGVSQATWLDLADLGIERQPGMAPVELFTWRRLLTPAGALCILLGGFLLGFGARWAGGCTSGHAISGLADRQLPSLIAVIGFFAGGLLVTHVVLPLLLEASSG